MAKNDVARRLAVLEREVADLKSRLEGASDEWPDCIFGRMKQFPEFAEVAEFGKNFRNAQTDPEE